MVERKVTVVNPTGLHLRPAGLLCQTSMKFDSKVMIFYKEKDYINICSLFVVDRILKSFENRKDIFWDIK